MFTANMPPMQEHKTGAVNENTVVRSIENALKIKDKVIIRVLKNKEYIAPKSIPLRFFIRPEIKPVIILPMHKLIKDTMKYISLLIPAKNDINVNITNTDV